MEPGSELEPRPVDEPAEATRASPDAGDEADDDSLTPAEKRLLVILGIGGLVVLLIVLAVNMLSGDDKAEPSHMSSQPKRSRRAQTRDRLQAAAVFSIGRPPLCRRTPPR